MQTKLTDEQLSQLRAFFDAGLTCGIGDEKQTCIEGALCLVLYGELNDEWRGEFDCRGRDVVAASIALNDGQWSSPAVRSKGMWERSGANRQRVSGSGADCQALRGADDPSGAAHRSSGRRSRGRRRPLRARR